MRRRGNETGRSGRADDFAAAGKWSSHFGAYFQVDLTIPVNRHMPTCPSDLLASDHTPHGAARIRNDLREFLWTRATPYHGKRSSDTMFESDFVFHAHHLLAPNP
jgi:hypothetical protein